jgi:hypothetical protein
VTLFDVGPRTDSTFARNAEGHFTYLNRGLRLEVEKIRDVLEGWFARYPDESKKGLRAAFRSTDTWQHQGAFFELALHELLVGLDCDVRLHPEIAGSAKRPDFLVEPATGAAFYLEATVATDTSAEDRSVQARVRALYDNLNTLDSPNFFLSIEVFETSTVQLSARKLRAELAKWLGTLDPDKEAAAYKRDQAAADPCGLPIYDYVKDGWRVHFRAIQKSLSTRGKAGVKPLGVMGSGEVQWIDSHTPLRDAVIGKARRYGALDLPSVIAVNALGEWSVDRNDVVDALFGEQTLTVRPRGRTRATRSPDGVWMSKGGPRYTRNSAVLMAHDLSPWTLGRAELCLYHNPWAARPYMSCLTRLPQGILVEDKMSWTDGRPTADILGLPSDWPFSSPA